MRKTNKDMGILQIGVNCIFETKNGWRNTLWTNLLASPIVGMIKHWWKMKWQNAIIWTSDRSQYQSTTEAPVLLIFVCTQCMLSCSVVQSYFVNWQ